MPTAKKLPSGTWRVRVYTGKKDGRSVMKSFTGTSKKEAERKASAYLAITQHNEMTFLDAAESYITAKESVIAPSTVRTYRLHLRRLEILHNVRLSRIDSERAQRAVDRMARTLAPKTVICAYGFLTAVMHMFEPGAVLRVTLPERQRKQTRIPTDEEVDLMISEAPSEDLRIAIQLAAFGSLRSGEACALRREDIKAGKVMIRRTYDLAEGEKWVIKDSPKTSAGNRDIPLPDALISQMRASVHDDGYILKYTPSSLHSAFRRLTDRLELYPYKFHALRHYFASKLHADGVPDKVIALIGGWEDISTLQRIYQHATADKVEAAGQVLADLFGSRIQKNEKVDTKADTAAT